MCMYTCIMYVLYICMAFRGTWEAEKFQASWGSNPNILLLFLLTELLESTGIDHYVYLYTYSYLSTPLFIVNLNFSAHRQALLYNCMYLHLYLQWINAYTVVALDTTERVHLVSVKDDTEIEVYTSFIIP